MTAKDCGSYRCKKYYDSCSTKCETCYTDTCDYPENSSYPLVSSCDYGCDTRGFITGCNKKCYTCATEPSEGCPTGFATTSNFSTKCLSDIGVSPENGNWLYDVYSPNGIDSSGKACYACKVQCNAGYQPIHEGCYDEAITFVVSTYDNLVTDYDVFDEVTSGSVTLAITTTSILFGWWLVIYF